MVVGRSVPRRRPLGRARPGAPTSLPRVFYSPLFLSSSGLPPVDGPCVVRINIYLRSISKIDDLSMVSMVQGSLSVVRCASSERYATLVSSKDLKQDQSSVSLQAEGASWEYSFSHCSLLAVRGVLVCGLLVFNLCGVVQSAFSPNEHWAPSYLFRTPLGQNIQ